MFNHNFYFILFYSLIHFLPQVKLESVGIDGNYLEGERETTKIIIHSKSRSTRVK